MIVEGCIFGSQKVFSAQVAKYNEIWWFYGADVTNIETGVTTTPGHCHTQDFLNRSSTSEDRRMMAPGALPTNTSTTGSGTGSSGASSQNR